MKPDIPILMITIHVPVVADITADEVMEAIEEQVRKALQKAKKMQESGEEPEPRFRQDLRAQAIKEPVVNETLESYTDTTRDDLLASLGYTSEG